FDIGPYSPAAGNAAPRLAVATDIGGGTRYSLPATLGSAYRTALLRGRRLSPERAFYLATLGNAEALGLEDEIGRLEPGRYADLVVLDPCATPLLAARDALSETLADTLLALMILGDDRVVRASWVAGRQLHPKQDSPSDRGGASAV
ncbi:MAG: amidohydrolase family protein, partial [Alphaproteobacteria bacterium]|nr:amidohydrolase family protein [Alphaproteobacteria bacterium]